MANSSMTVNLESEITGNIKQIAKATQGLGKTAEKQLALSGTMDKLVKSGAVSFGSGMAKEFAQNYFGSMGGDAAGTITSSALSTAITGAGIVGTLVPTPLGIAGGALAGLALGGLSGISQVKGEKDDAFKAYVREQFDQVTQGQADGLAQGAALAAQREAEAAPEGAETYLTLTDKLLTAQDDLNAAMGTGYNTQRKAGLAEQEAWLSGDSGAAMQEVYSMIGQWKASLENTKERLEREALDAVMTGTLSEALSDSPQGQRLTEMAQEYQAALADYEAGSEEAGAKLGALLAEAQVIALNEYNASEGAQLALESEKSLAEAIRTDTAGNSDYWSAGYEKGQWFTKGLAAAIGGTAYTVETTVDAESGAVYWTDQYGNPVDSMLVDPSGNSGFPSHQATKTAKNFQAGDMAALPAKHTSNDGAPAQKLKDLGLYAVGIDYVPYDNFPALLHQGERVQTAVEARSERSAPTITITGNTFTIREDADVQRVASEILTQLELAGQRG